MFTFLRRIRKSLFESGSARKYFLYAIGEIILVVIGILVALSINTWNIDRIERKEEQRILVSVLDEMNMLRWQIARGRDTYSEVVRAADRLITTIDDPSYTLPNDTIKYDLTQLRRRWLLGKGNASTIYDALTGSGEFGLIRSDPLRKLLNSLKRDMMLLGSYETSQTDFVDDHLSPYLHQHIKALEISDIRDRIRRNRYTPHPGLVEFTPDSGTSSIAYNALVQSQEFSNLLEEHMRHTATLLPIYRRLGGYVLTIDSILTEEITIEDARQLIQNPD